MILQYDSSLSINIKTNFFLTHDCVGTMYICKKNIDRRVSNLKVLQRILRRKEFSKNLTQSFVSKNDIEDITRRGDEEGFSTCYVHVSPSRSRAAPKTKSPLVGSGGTRGWVSELKEGTSSLKKRNLERRHTQRPAGSILLHVEGVSARMRERDKWSQRGRGRPKHSVERGQGGETKLGGDKECSPSQIWLAVSSRFDCSRR